MSNVISFEDMRKLWKGVGLSGCMQLVFDGQRKTVTLVKKALVGIIYCQYKMGCKTEG